MSDKNTLRHHAGLVDTMATTLGVDLQEAALSGAVTIDEISEAVLRCTGCSNPGHCEAHLAKVSSAEKAPEYCRNTRLFERLKF